MPHLSHPHLQQIDACTHAEWYCQLSKQLEKKDSYKDKSNKLWPRKET